MLIDGGVIANNPALLANMYATHILREKDLRILSLGTGMPIPTEYDLDGWNRRDFDSLSYELILDIDIDMVDSLLEKMFKRHLK